MSTRQTRNKLLKIAGGQADVETRHKANPGRRTQGRQGRSRGKIDGPVVQTQWLGSFLPSGSLQGQVLKLNSPILLPQERTEMSFWLEQRSRKHLILDHHVFAINPKLGKAPLF
jgi:hypothetical protein